MVRHGAEQQMVRHGAEQQMVRHGAEQQIVRTWKNPQEKHHPLIVFHGERLRIGVISFPYRFFSISHLKTEILRDAGHALRGNGLAYYCITNTEARLPRGGRAIMW